MNETNPQQPSYEPQPQPQPQPQQPQPQPTAGWRGTDRKTRIGAAIAGIALCGFGFLGGMAVGTASADDGQGGPGWGGGRPGMGGGPPGMSQDGTGPQGGGGMPGGSGTDSGI
ncbi:hypothetical protein FE697_005380 [Mumia zhuanghuii]|uniref:Uncharacterized protein n=2 Tax=Mumia TaxID=1546255 RepID=A0ABW1QH33_9ACTN|nr:MULTISPECIES: hypothetical protein [Mumia]KAA1425292.1 hypothetical protein FE697_005380 [Mumia zhuanghuii]